MGTTFESTFEIFAEQSLLTLANPGENQDEYDKVGLPVTLTQDSDHLVLFFLFEIFIIMHIWGPDDSKSRFRRRARYNPNLD